MSLFFTADTHFGHANVIKYAHRPFAHADEMDATMMKNWNATVQPKDTVWHLGDVSFHKVERTVSILRRLNGTKHLVFGNHDKKLRKEDRFLECFASTHDLTEIKEHDPDAADSVQRVVLCHYAMCVWNKSHYGAWQLYGHSHGSLPDNPYALQLDVGVDVWGYTPVRYETIKTAMSRKLWEPIDHHRPRR